MANFLADKTAWSQNLYNGFPLQADPQVMAWYPFEIVLNIFHLSFNIYVLIAYILASYFTYLFSYKLTGFKLPSISAGIIFGLSGFMMGHLGHTVMIHTLAWLPLILLSIENLSEKFSIKWGIILSLAYACMELAGHPQMFLYCSLLIIAYLFFKVIDTKNNKWKFFITICTFIIIGIGISAVELLPANQLSKYSARESISYDTFISYSESPKTLLSTIFPFVYGGNTVEQVPYFGQYNYTELSFYAGSLTLILVFYAILYKRKDRQVIFWTLIACVSLILALGPYIPILDKLLYHVPVYNLFKVPARHVAEFDFSISILAALGITVLLKKKLSKRQFLAPILIISVVSTLSYIALLIIRHKITYSALEIANLKNYSIVPWKNIDIAIPILILFLGSIILFISFKFKKIYKNIICLVLVVINMFSFAWFLEWNQYAPNNSILEENPKITQLNDQLIENNAKLLALRGVTDPVFPPDIYSLEWNGQNATGYTPLLSQRFADLLFTNNAGVITNSPSLLNQTNQTLDLLGITTIAVPRNEILPQTVFHSNDYGWSNINDNIILNSQNSSYKIFTPNINISSIGMILSGKNICHFSEGMHVGEISVMTDRGATIFPLRNGIEVFENECSSLPPKETNIFQDNTGNHSYFINLPISGSIKDITIKWDNQDSSNSSSMLIQKIAFRANDNNFISVNPSLSALYGPNWKDLGSIQSDEIFQNYNKPMKAWFVENVVNTDSNTTLKTLRESVIDSAPYNFKKTALTDGSLVNQNFKTTLNIPIVTSPSPTIINVTTNNDNESLMVLNQQYYPEWEVTIDGKVAPIYQTDYILMGVKIPKGNHKIIFTYSAKTTKIGIMISITSLLILFLIVLYRYIAKNHFKLNLKKLSN